MGKRWEAAFRLLGIGWYIATCIILGTLGGRWLGQKLDGDSGEVILTILGLLLGLALAFIGTYRMLIPIMSNKQDNDRGKG